MNINTNTLVSEIVSDNYNTASLFNRYGIDFCCNGNRSLGAVATEQKLSLEDLIAELTSILEQSAPDQNYQDWELDFLCDYIYQTHHIYVEKQSEEISMYLDKICKVHGEAHPELFEVRSLFKGAVGDLAIHMKKEELILFPYIKTLVKASKTKVPLERPPFGSIDNPIHMMHEEHDNEGERFRKIAALTDNYTIPEDGCHTYMLTYNLLKAFEADLHKHIHIENNILFKRAVRLEQDLNH